MAIFDLSAYASPLPGDGQLYHSGALGPAAFHNCTFEAARETLISYGYSPPDDAALRNSVAPGSTGGEPWGVSQAAIRKVAPDLPTAVEFPADVPGTIRYYGSLGYVVHVGFWCDTNAYVPPHTAIVGSHAAIAVSADATTVLFKNPWPHPEYRLTDSQIRALYDGDGILVFKKDIREADLTPQEHAWLENIANEALATNNMLRGSGAYAELDELVGPGGVPTAANPGLVRQILDAVNKFQVPAPAPAPAVDFSPLTTALAGLKTSLDANTQVLAAVQAKINKDLA